MSASRKNPDGSSPKKVIQIKLVPREENSPLEATRAVGDALECGIPADQAAPPSPGEIPLDAERDHDAEAKIVKGLDEDLKKDAEEYRERQKKLGQEAGAHEKEAVKHIAEASRLRARQLAAAIGRTVLAIRRNGPKAAKRAYGVVEHFAVKVVAEILMSAMKGE